MDLREALGYGVRIGNAMQANRLITACPVGCRTELVETDILLAEGPLLRCVLCGQLLSSCTKEQYQSALRKWDTSNGTQPDPRSVSRFRQVTQRRLRDLHRLLGSLPARPRLLDIGCSSGALLSVATEVGFSVTGVEIASNAVETARLAGFEVFCGYLHEANFPHSMFDVITCFELVEHLDDPIGLLTECRRIMKPDGIVTINTPNADSWTARFMRERWDGFSLISMGGHISFFSPRSLSRLAEQCGFRIERLETRRVRFAESHHVSPIAYHVLKVMGEVLNVPSGFLDKGHDMLAFLRKV